MSLNMWDETDLKNALLAAKQAVNSMADASGVGSSVVTDPDDPQAAFTAGFLTGYRAALTTLALAFGLGLKAELSPDHPKPVPEEAMAFLAITPPSRRF